VASGSERQAQGDDRLDVPPGSVCGDADFHRFSGGKAALYKCAQRIYSVTNIDFLG
jgi:hypothetical protein